MTRTTLHRWIWIHKWTSLLCTVFLLVLCITGLPLLFHHEIHEALEHHDNEREVVSNNTAYVSLDRLIDKAKQRYPGYLVFGLFFDDERPHVVVRMTPTFEELERRPPAIEWVRFDLRSGAVIETFEEERSRPKSTLVACVNSVMRFMTIVHINLYADFPGQIFLAVMGVLFIASILSGVVLYGPFARRRAFGSIRTGRTSRLTWLDIHNVIGIVLLVWMLVVGITGVINEFARPLVGLWRTNVQSDLRASNSVGVVPTAQDQMMSVQAALGVVQKALPGMTVRFLSYPTTLPTAVSSDHYSLIVKGDSPLTARLTTIALVNVKTGTLDRVLEMPWYLRTLELSRPLHFGDYGGLPLKIIWALLDLVTIVVLGSGLYLWLSKRKSPIEGRNVELESEIEAPVLVRIPDAAK